jgi:hypothetical protein
MLKKYILKKITTAGIRTSARLYRLRHGTSEPLQPSHV